MTTSSTRSGRAAVRRHRHNPVDPVILNVSSKMEAKTRARTPRRSFSAHGGDGASDARALKSKIPALRARWTTPPSSSASQVRLDFEGANHKSLPPETATAMFKVLDGRWPLVDEWCAFRNTDRGDDPRHVDPDPRVLQADRRGHAGCDPAGAYVPRRRVRRAQARAEIIVTNDDEESRRATRLGRYDRLRYFVNTKVQNARNVRREGRRKRFGVSRKHHTFLSSLFFTRPARCASVPQPGGGGTPRRAAALRPRRALAPRRATSSSPPRRPPPVEERLRERVERFDTPPLPSPTPFTTPAAPAPPPRRTRASAPARRRRRRRGARRRAGTPADAQHQHRLDAG